MANSRFSENWLSGGKSLNDSWYTDRLKQQQDEEDKRKEDELLKAQQEQATKAEESAKPWYQKAVEGAGDVAGAVGNFVKDAAVDVYKTGESAVTGIKDVVEGQVAANKMDGVTEQVNELNKKRSAYMDTLQDADYDKPEVKQKLAEMQAEVENAQGQINDDDKKQMQESQDVDATKTAADTAETFLNVATLGTGTALKAGGKAAVKQGVKEVAKMGAKDVAKAVGRGAAEGAVFSGAAGLTDAVSEDMNAEDAVANIAKSATFGALLGGASAGVGKGLGVKKNNKAFSAQEAAKAADEANIASVGDGVDAIAKDLDELNANPLRDVPDDELMGKIQEFQSADATVSRTPEDYKAYQIAKDEMSARERANYYKEGGKSPAEAQKALDELNEGKNIPETAYKEATPVRNLDEVLTRDDIPVEIKNAANEVADDRMAVDNQLGQLMSPDTKAAELGRVDENYALGLRELNQKYGDPLNPGSASSDIRFQTAKQKLDDQYKDSVSELDMLEAKDADEVAKYTGIRDQLAGREQNIIADTRKLMQEAPDQFRDIDEVELNAYKKSLEDQLNTATRFGDSKEIVAEAATSPNPAKSIDANPDGKAAVRANLVDSTNNLEGFKNTSAVRQSMLGLLTPSKNLEAMGLRDLADNVMTADARQQLANKADFEKLKPIAEALKGNKAIQKQIVEYLEGTRKELSATDTQTAQMIRGFLDEKRAILKEQGFETLDDYFPHMFDKNNDGVQKLFKGKTTGDINFGNLKQRVSDSDDFSKEITDVLATYSQGLNKKIYLEPALKPLQELSNYDKISTLEAKWVDSYIDQLKNNKRSNIEEGFNNIVSSMMQKAGKQGDGNYYRSILGGQRMMSAVATMGINPGTALRNMTQMVNTVAGIGPKWSSIGLKRGTQALMEGKGSPAYKEMAEAGVFSGGVSKNYNADLDQFDSNIRGIKGRSNGVANKMMIMVSASDSFLRAQAYWGAKAKAVSKGMNEADAMKFAREKVVDTQFITSKVDMPTALNGPGMRSLTQLATFSAKQAEFLADLGIKTVRKDGKWHLDPESAGRILAAAGAAGVATAALEPTIGFNKEEWIPFYANIAPFIPGNDKAASDALYRSPLVTLLAGDGKSKMGLVEAIQSGDIGEWFKDQAPAIIPGGTQIKKTTEGLDTTLTGESRNDKGNLRYLQDMGVDESIKAALFGQYSTEAGRNWIKEGFPTLSESQTTSLAGKDRSTQEQYQEYYNAAKKAGKGRQDKYDEIKAAAQAGDVNKAARLGKEYNDQVTKAMGEYWKSNDTLPEDLKKQMLSEVYINASNVVKNNSQDD